MRSEEAVDTKDSRATLATVAASAGVSVATVSKVLNGRSDVAPATRALVQDLLEEHDYVGRRPDPGRFQTVELLFHDELNAYSLEVFEGILSTARELDTAVAVSLRPRGEGRTAAARSGAWVRGLVNAGRQAVITVTSELPAADLSALARARIPIVVIDPFDLPRTRVTSVGSTNFLGGPTAAACNQARMQGYRAAMEAEGAPVPEGYVRSGRFHHRDGVVEGAALLGLAERPTAVFAGSDETALGIIEAARSRGLRVPEDLSIVGFDDTSVARFASPPLTTVRQPLREMGAAALRRALRLAAGEKVDSYHVELATELVVRHSTAPPAAG